MVRRAGAMAVLAASLVVLCGCSPSSTRPTPTSEATPDAVPTATAIDPVRLAVDERLEAMTLEQKIRSMLMLHYPGTDPAPVREFADHVQPGGLILMGDNIGSSEEEVRAFTSALSSDEIFPLLLGIDEEGGDVTRLPWDELPAGSTLADSAPELTTEAFTARSELLESAGLSVNFGIVADVTADPSSFIYYRVLGHDPASAADRVTRAVQAESGHVYSTLKHFPGHGGAPGDSHSSIPVAGASLDEWRATDAVPFAAGIAAGAPLVMTAHVAYPAVDSAPASLSAAWHNILRDELEFTGVTITDDMLMLQRNGLAEFADPVENAIRAIAAGNDMLVYVLPADPGDVDIDLDALVSSVAAAIDSGRISEDAIDASVDRLLCLRFALGG
ncbi:glycoside hydrolase family 3 N-terminal domain-containing protein [Agromyces atrinae]|uniref:Beta-N-acetylhexosaminidase n=1 Tax=Agromyces atrinae TaxID=592376 RepID=A0A4Q2M3F4_9MICO|nr:glycoside hydrolase family 3 N-terminal domain-containing protein [Agromyces atrinae]NYD66175.1 beta-N-acetylhexosaminidase [Agromyces atrinae]RXZ86514.1 glycoside hydrolase family 3 protein [Agromyces atrinae]